MRKPSRALLIYSAAVVLLAVALYTAYRNWNDGGRSEKKMREKEIAQEPISLKYYLAVWGPRAALINSGLCALLLAAGPFGVRKFKGASAALPPQGSNKITLAVLATVMVGSALWLAPRLQQSLWEDEATSMRKFMVGDCVKGHDGTMEYHPVSLENRLFDYKSPNNHLLYSVIAGGLHQATVHESKDPLTPYFREWVIRLPAFIAGMAALASIVWLATELGMKHVGWLAVILLALHPWHLRYSAEARGYSMLIALFPALLSSALRGIRTGQWRWWTLFALIEVVMVDTWLLSANVIFMTNLVVLGLIVTSERPREDRLTLAGRWFITNVFATMILKRALGNTCAPPIPCRIGA